QNGCICCTLRDEFIKQIEKISAIDSVEVIFVEASGISDPGAVSASFLAYEEDNPDTNVYLTSVVTVVDADRIYREFLDELKKKQEDKEKVDENNLTDEEISTLIVDQIEFCNFIVLNKCDLLNEKQLAEVEAIVRQFQTRAPIYHSVNGNIELSKITTKKPFNFEQIDSSSAIQKAINSLNEPKRAKKGCTDEYGISSFVFEEKRPFNRERFADFVNNNYPKELIRAKGYIWFSDADADVQLFEQAGRNSSVMEVSYWIDALVEEQKQAFLEQNPDVKENWDEEFGDRENQIVFIGKGYNQAAIKAALENCLDDKAIA
ncbi:MAG: GTP-binding protein, partial [Treponema sp.]|nr:GTP-binding protein [Treponema sp.]